MYISPNHEKKCKLEAPLFLPQLPKQAQLAKRKASTDCLAIPASSTFGLKVAFFDKNAIFSPNIELAGIARECVEASRLALSLIHI